jgi:hypothetical protein
MQFKSPVLVRLVCWSGVNLLNFDFKKSKKKEKGKIEILIKLNAFTEKENTQNRQNG